MAISEWDEEKPTEMRSMFSEFYDETDFPIHENFGSYWSANKNSVDEVAERDLNIPSIYAEVESKEVAGKSLS
jgi:hypothetical protein